MFDLSKEMSAQINTNIQLATSRLKPYVDCEANSRDHLMIVARHMAKEVIDDITLSSSAVDFIPKYRRWINKWYCPKNFSKMLDYYANIIVSSYET